MTWSMSSLTLLNTYLKAVWKLAPMTLGEVRKFVRALPEWQQTGNAKDQARALAFAIGKTFGEVA